jgi:hyaluronan synthase
MQYIPITNSNGRVAFGVRALEKSKSILISWKMKLATFIFFSAIFTVLVLKIVGNREFMNHDFLFLFYSTAVSLYLISRFALAYFYRPVDAKFTKNIEPTVSFAVPSKNEGEHIRETIMRMVASDYPKEKFDIIAINDGSTDNTLEEMLIAKELARKEGVNVKVVDWQENKGKREGMAECVKQSDKDIVLFVDSDSFIEPNMMKKMVKYFELKNVGAVAGQAFVANADVNFLTHMQSVRYYVAFRAFKSSEALFGSVTCCSGCLAAYRRSAILPLMDKFTNQYFLGVKCTYGDDRSLTNLLLKNNYDTIFAPDAIAYTFVPDNFKQYVKQQLRWKKSWFRESFMASFFMWRRNVLMSLSFYLGFILPLFAPLILVRALVWYPIKSNYIPLYYIFGLLIMALIYGLYYYRHTKDKNWFSGTIFTVFFNLVLFWQLPYALLKIRDSKWGTR